MAPQNQNSVLWYMKHQLALEPELVSTSLDIRRGENRRDWIKKKLSEVVSLPRASQLGSRGAQVLSPNRVSLSGAVFKPCPALAGGLQTQPSAGVAGTGSCLLVEPDESIAGSPCGSANGSWAPASGDYHSSAVQMPSSEGPVSCCPEVWCLCFF